MRKLVIVFGLVLMASSAQATTLNVVGGQLHGAFGVNVDGSLYDVQFLDGTCVDLYNGCDDVSDFTFQTQGAALLAAQALLDQVFLDGADLFDTDPELTIGCSDVFVCNASTPYAIPDVAVLLVAAAQNQFTPGTEMGDSVLATVIFDYDVVDLGFETILVYAVWTPVPEPNTALLLGFGLVGLAVRRTR